MSTQKYKVIEKEFTSKTGQPYKGLAYTPIAVMCKKCKLYSRRPGSAYCEHCAEAHKQTLSK